MALPVIQVPTAQVLWAGEPFYRFSPVADMTAANARSNPITIPRPNASLWWPMLQVSYYFSAGVALTAVLRPHLRDMDTGDWHALSIINMLDAAVTTDVNSQMQQFEIGPQHDAIALEIDLTNAADRPHITLRPCAWVSLPVPAVM